MNITQAKKINIVAWLAEQGIHPKGKSCQGELLYLSPCRQEKHPSFSVSPSKNVWHDFATGEGGSIVDLIMALRHVDVRGALAILANGDNSLYPCCHLNSTHFVDVNGNKERIQIQAVKELRHPALLRYIRERCIPEDIARQFCKEIHYTNGDYSFFAVGFPNANNGWEVRNEREGSKRTIYSKMYSFVPNGADNVVIFEGFFDFLSFLAALSVDKRQKHDYLILNSVSLVKYARNIINDYDYSTIYTALDNDEAGRKATENIIGFRLHGVQAIDLAPRYAPHNDINEWLCHNPDRVFNEQVRASGLFP